MTATTEQASEKVKATCVNNGSMMREVMIGDEVYLMDDYELEGFIEALKVIRDTSYSAVSRMIQRKTKK